MPYSTFSPNLFIHPEYHFHAWSSRPQLCWGILGIVAVCFIWSIVTFCKCICPGTHLTNSISIEFIIRQKIEVIHFKIYLTSHNKFLYMSRQLYWNDVCKILFWSVKNVLNQSTTNFGQTLNSICLVSQVGNIWKIFFLNESIQLHKNKTITAFFCQTKFWCSPFWQHL